MNNERENLTVEVVVGSLILSPLQNKESATIMFNRWIEEVYGI